MASYRQLPEALRETIAKTPWLSLVLFAGVAPILVILPGDVNFVGTLYSLGATLSPSRSRTCPSHAYGCSMEGAQRSCTGQARTSVWAASRGRSSRSAGPWPRARPSSCSSSDPATRWAGLGWMVAGLAGYVVYRSGSCELRCGRS